MGTALSFRPRAATNLLIPLAMRELEGLILVTSYPRHRKRP